MDHKRRAQMLVTVIFILAAYLALTVGKSYAQHSYTVVAKDVQLSTPP